MARPFISRRISFEPKITYYKPKGVPLSILEEVTISFEEFEAIRLKDLKGFDQEYCAKKMNISQPTFHRIIISSRKKVAEAIINGKALKIQGGNFKL